MESELALENIFICEGNEKQERYFNTDTPTKYSYNTLGPIYLRNVS